MVSRQVTTIRHERPSFSYADAVHVDRDIPSGARYGEVLVDFQHTTDTTLAALARLVVLRRQLRRGGGELRIHGLEGRADRLFEVHRLGELLPRR